jgi:hypothetical protein
MTESEEVKPRRRRTRQEIRRLVSEFGTTEEERTYLKDWWGAMENRNQVQILKAGRTRKR